MTIFTQLSTDCLWEGHLQRSIGLSMKLFSSVFVKWQVNVAQSIKSSREFALILMMGETLGLRDKSLIVAPTLSLIKKDLCHSKFPLRYILAAKHCLQNWFEVYNVHTMQTFQLLTSQQLQPLSYSELLTSKFVKQVYCSFYPVRFNFYIEPVGKVNTNYELWSIYNKTSKL